MSYWARQYATRLLIVASCSAWACPDNLVARGTADPAVLGRFRLASAQSPPTYEGPNTKQIAWNASGEEWLVSSGGSQLIYRSAPSKFLSRCPTHVLQWEALWAGTWRPSRLTFEEATGEEVFHILEDLEARGPDLCPPSIVSRGTDDPVVSAMFVLLKPLSHLRPRFTDRSTNYIAWNASSARWVVASVTLEATQALYRAAVMKQEHAYCPTDVLIWEVAEGGEWKRSDLTFVHANQTDEVSAMQHAAGYINALRPRGAVDFGPAIVGTLQFLRRAQSGDKPSSGVWTSEATEMGGWRGQEFVRVRPTYEDLSGQVLIWKDGRWCFLAVNGADNGNESRSGPSSKWYRAEDPDRQYAWFPTYVRRWSAFVHNMWVPSNLTFIHATGDDVLRTEKEIIRKVVNLSLSCPESVDVVIPKMMGKLGKVSFQGTFVREVVTEVGYPAIAYRGEVNKKAMHLFYHFGCECWTLDLLWAGGYNEDCPRRVILHRIDPVNDGSDTLYVSKPGPDVIEVIEHDGEGDGTFVGRVAFYYALIVLRAPFCSLLDEKQLPGWGYLVGWALASILFRLPLKEEVPIIIVVIESGSVLFRSSQCRMMIAFWSHCALSGCAWHFRAWDNEATVFATAFTFLKIWSSLCPRRPGLQQWMPGFLAERVFTGQLLHEEEMGCALLDPTETGPTEAEIPGIMRTLV